MRDNAIVPRPARRFRGLSRRAPGHTAAPNLLQPNFTAERPNYRWLADSTEFMPQEGKLYLAEQALAFRLRPCIFGVFPLRSLQQMRILSRFHVGVASGPSAAS